jgi:hypothetical protein
MPSLCQRAPVKKSVAPQGQIRAGTLEYGIALRIVGISSQRRRTRFAGGREFVLMLMTRSHLGVLKSVEKAVRSRDHGEARCAR